MVVSDAIENFDFDNQVPSAIQIGYNIIAFDLPKNVFIEEILKVGMTRDFGQYKVLCTKMMIDITLSLLYCTSHCLGMNYYVNFFGGIGSNGFHIK